MKNVLKTGFSTIVLLLSLANCGKSSNNSGSTYNPYGTCGTGVNSQNCYNNAFSNYYGPGNYYQGTQYFGGSPCQVYQVPQYYGCYSGCGQQYYVVAPQGAYIPEYGIYGNGGSFFSASLNFGWGG